ncbi:MAG: pyrimidine/purine nucleoside phosphorylase [Candidatus Delongbacteria bacterium]|nr:pyrimidine/purine nucleoside phosphorylase [Candidatus Delongbacteria bacterium]MCG2760316.1 pyrimidine/purine nucleoside phosphorylase [Candidatus Delongbacteria bacterium]
MFKTNEYFGGKVKSLAFKTKDCSATVGVMAQGEYEFGTTSKEFLTVTSGKLTVKMPGDDAWKSYGPNETMIIEPNIKFKVVSEGDSSYICLYK